MPPRITRGKPTRIDRGIHRKPKYKYDPSQTRQRLIRITLKDGTSTGMILRDGGQNLCAPEVSFMVNWDLPRIKQYCKHHQHKIEFLSYYKEGDENPFK